MPGQVLNQLYLDTAPFDSAGRPANGWQLLSEYTDVQGKRAGRHYDTLADWGGWQTALRMDGYRSMDFALPSVRRSFRPHPERQGDRPSLRPTSAGHGRRPWRRRARRSGVAHVFNGTQGRVSIARPAEQVW